MPARKPSTLITRAETKEDKTSRLDAENSFTPKAELPIKPPLALKGHKLASAMWKKIVALYSSIDGKIATLFDEDLLIQYCLLIEELPWLTDIRKSVETEYKSIQKQVVKSRSLKLTDQAYKNYINLLNQLNALLTRMQGLDARLDGKRKLIHTLSQSLYLTPRSRAGVAPAPKEKENIPMDPMEELLQDLEFKR